MTSHQGRFGVCVVGVEDGAAEGAVVVLMIAAGD